MALDVLNINNPEDTPYRVDATKWYKSYPYGFAFWSFDAKNGSLASETFWLPIAPSNINVTTHYATNIITTLYGTIEEHSEVRYYDIVIQGNTGIAPKYTVPFKNVEGAGNPAGVAVSKPGIPSPNKVSPGNPSVGRSSFGSAATAGVLGGFLPEVTNSFAAAANLVNNIKNPGGRKNPTGITPEQSGYYAFHNFYKFLLRYKADTSRIGKEGEGSKLTVLGPSPTNKPSQSGRNAKRAVHPLQFLNYKDNIKYNCVPISFTLTRSAERPMLYDYNIRLRAFGLQNVNAKAVNSDNLRAELGLGGLEGSIFSKITSVVGNCSTLLSGIKGAF